MAPKLVSGTHLSYSIISSTWGLSAVHEGYRLGRLASGLL